MFRCHRQIYFFHLEEALSRFFPTFFKSVKFSLLAYFRKSHCYISKLQASYFTSIAREALLFEQTIYIKHTIKHFPPVVASWHYLAM